MQPLFPEEMAGQLGRVPFVVAGTMPEQLVWVPEEQVLELVFREKEQEQRKHWIPGLEYGLGRRQWLRDRLLFFLAYSTVHSPLCIF